MNSTAREAFTTMERHLTEVTVELFDSYGMPLSLCAPARPNEPPRLDEQSVMAVIGYAGEKVRGSLVLVASKAAIEYWLTAIGSADQGVDVCDTLGEFSNMLLGRLKARLSPEGFPILLSTPTTASGSGLRLSPPLRPSAVFSFAGPTWGLDVRIDATFEEDFTLQAVEDRGAAVEAGDMMLF